MRWHRKAMVAIHDPSVAAEKDVAGGCSRTEQLSNVVRANVFPETSKSAGRATAVGQTQIQSKAAEFDYSAEELEDERSQKEVLTNAMVRNATSVSVA